MFFLKQTREEQKELSTLAWGWLLSEAAAGLLSPPERPVCCLTSRNHQPALLPLILSVLGVVALLRCLSALPSSSHWKEPRELSRGASRAREGRGLS